MPIQTDSDAVVTSYLGRVPGAAGRAPQYLQGVARDVHACGLPVSLLRESVAARLLPAGRVEGVVTVPWEPTLARLVCAHVAWDDGDDLVVGWFLVDEDPDRGPERAAVDAAVSLAQAAHVCVVTPTARRIGGSLVTPPGWARHPLG